jgi:uncharacterized membrane protein YhaH (DUF805 family)
MDSLNNTSRIWFPAKRYGWGWGPPVKWQGWVVLILWIAVLTCGAIFLAGRHWVAYAVFLVIMAAILIAICYAKGEKPRWRWGEKN